MGQYYRGVVVKDVDTVSGEERVVSASLCPYDFHNGAKLMEHSYIGNDYMNAYMQLLGEFGPFYGQPFAWVGDYSDEEDIWGFYTEAKTKTDDKTLKQYKDVIEAKRNYKYLLNLDRKEYVVLPELKEDEWQIHPLSLLTAVGNQRGGGDYFGEEENNVGLWAFNRIGFANAVSENYKQVEFHFKERNH